MNISHGVFGRALCSAGDRLLRQQHEASLAQVTSALPPAEGRLLRSCSWHVSSGCCDHDAHNGMKWSLGDAAANKDLMKHM